MLMPVGIPGMMNLLRENGFEVTGLNVPMEIMIDQRFDLAAWLARQRNVRLVAIDLHWYEHAFGALDVARICKQVYPRIPIVLGGLSASYFAEQILRDFSQVDFVISGDGEHPLLSLARRICREGRREFSDIPNLCFRKGTEVVRNEQSYCAAIRDLDGLNFVDTDFLVHEDQYRELQFSLSQWLEVADASAPKGHWLTIGRGCHFDCSFCGGGKESHATIAGRHGIISRSPTRVADDLERLRGMGVQQVSFNLDPAIMGREYWTQLFAEMRRRKIRIGIYNECFQLPTRDFLQAFVETADLAYSELAFSPLSGSDQVRQLNGKRFTNDQLMDVLAQLRPHSVPIFVYFSLNLPGENRKTFRQTRQFAQQICRNYPPKLLRMLNMCHTLDPCCLMSRQPEQYGIDLEFSSFLDYYRYCQETPVLQQDAALEDWRGFRIRGNDSHSLEKMARQWNGLCRAEQAQCYPVPRTW
jgi:radical SAM superfamily enzyme YgiQ (UPF0313 family)